jgi:hypothetical protein
MPGYSQASYLALPETESTSYENQENPQQTGIHYTTKLRGLRGNLKFGIIEAKA